jgi:hypothetical protein
LYVPLDMYRDLVTLVLLLLLLLDLVWTGFLVSLEVVTPPIHLTAATPECLFLLHVQMNDLVPCYILLAG